MYLHLFEIKFQIVVLEDAGASCHTIYFKE